MFVSQTVNFQAEKNLAWFNVLLILSLLNLLTMIAVNANQIPNGIKNKILANVFRGLPSMITPKAVKAKVQVVLRYH